jgi:hypothetical protein
LASEQPGLANHEPLNKCKPVPQHKPVQRKEKATPSVQRKEKATPSPTPAAPSVQTDGGSHMCLDNSDADSDAPELLTPQERQHALARMLTNESVRSILRKNNHESNHQGCTLSRWRREDGRAVSSYRKDCSECGDVPILLPSSNWLQGCKHVS